MVTTVVNFHRMEKQPYLIIAFVCSFFDKFKSNNKQYKSTIQKKKKNFFYINQK